MGLTPNRPTTQVRQDHRPGDGQVPSARRFGDLRFVGPHGPAFRHALPAGGWPGKFRLGGWRSAGGRCGTPKRASRKVATALLEDIDKETVDFKPNYDDSEQEPEVLPTRVPNLLVNGSSGIAVGMATNIPPHNLTEIINATIHLIQHPTAELAKIMEFVQGPDFPTGGFILGRQGILRRLHDAAAGS